MKNTIILLLLCFACFNVFSENTFHNPDKVYLHLDRSLYVQGDTIWIKGYAMQRGTNIPSDKSYAIHIQMLDAAGEQVGEHKLLLVNGEAVGQIELFSMMKPGFYQLIAHTGYMKNFDSRFFFKTTIEVREKEVQRTIETRFDKINYGYGDTAELHFAVTDKYQNPVGDARFVYEYMQGDKVLKRKGVRCYEDGTMQIKLPLLAQASTEKAYLRLSYLENDNDNLRHQQQVDIPMINRGIHLDFFPEGGDGVVGLAQKVAFKAYDNQYMPLAVAGELLRDGEAVMSIKTAHDGMGFFSYVPDAAHYTLRLKSPLAADTLFHLPKVKSQGMTLSYRDQDEEVVQLSIAHNYDQTQHCKLWVSYCDSLIDVQDLTVDGVLSISVSKDYLPQGIVCFTISDEAGVPQAERLVYVAQEEVGLAIATDKDRYALREKVAVSIALDEPTVSRLSVAVIDSALGTSTRVPVSSIKAYAKLESELKGYIHNANQYLANDSSSAAARDLLLMTHGWRHFAWMAHQAQLSAMHLRNYNEVHGQVTRLGKPYSKAEVVVLELVRTLPFKTYKVDKAGCFSFTPDYSKRRDKSLLVIANAKKVNFLLKLALENTDTLCFGEAARNSALVLRPSQQIFTQEQVKEREVKEQFMLYDTQVLQELEVRAENLDWDMDKYLTKAQDMQLGTELEEFEEFEYLLTQVSNRLLFDGENNTRGAAIPSYDRVIVETSCEDRVDVINDRTCESYLSVELGILFDRNSNPPGALIYLNNKPLGYSLSTLDFLRKSDVSAVAVFDGVAAFEQFGIEAYYGAIMVYTYSKDILKKREIALNKVLFGNFVKARKFAQPSYENLVDLQTVAQDKRVTLHWQHFFNTDLDGRASCSFFTGDVPGTKEIIVQGFDDDGNLYYQKASFVVKDKVEP